MSQGDFIFPCAERTSLSSYGELPLDTCELAACPHAHTHTYTQARKCVCIVRSHESLKSATDDISCCWLHIGSGGGAGRHGGQFSGTCNTGLACLYQFSSSVSLPFNLYLLPSFCPYPFVWLSYPPISWKGKGTGCDWKEIFIGLPDLFATATTVWTIVRKNIGLDRLPHTRKIYSVVYICMYTIPWLFIELLRSKIRPEEKINWREDHKRIDHKAGLRDSAPSMLNICRHRLHYSQKVDQGAAERQQESISRGAKCRWRCVGLNFNSYEWISLNRAEKISSITLRCHLPSVLFRLFCISWLHWITLDYN